MRFSTKKIAAPRFHSNHLKLTVVPFLQSKVKLNGEWIDSTITYDEDGCVYVFTTEYFDTNFTVVSRRTPTDISVPAISSEALMLAPKYVHTKSDGHYALYTNTLAYIIEEHTPVAAKIYVSETDGQVYVRLKDDFNAGFTLIIGDK